MRTRAQVTTLKATSVFILSVGLGSCQLFYGTFSPKPPVTPPTPQNITLLDQGGQWDDANRAAFYTEDQGSRIMPLAWFQALRRPDRSAFAGDGLARFGYLANPSSAAGLPVGFTTGNWQNVRYVGMTCSACHTRQIRVNEKYYRIDGGPALADLEGLFAELDAATQSVLASDLNFAAFAAAVLGNTASVAAVAQLRADVTAWAASYHTLMTIALPKAQPWGLSRADAVGMILNRVGGLDIGTTPDRMIASNIRLADAPARYPFLWNATVQDQTQWPGFAPNGNDLFGLIRNLGEVYGVFGIFKPHYQFGWVGGIKYVNSGSGDTDAVNSANFRGLDRLEQMTRRIGKPSWPWSLDQGLRSQGAGLFVSHEPDKQSCADCHGVKARVPFPLMPVVWKTPLIDVATDRHEYDTLSWVGQSGVLQGSYIYLPVNPIGPTSSLITILSASVGGSVLQQAGLRLDLFSSSLSLVINNPAKYEPAVVDTVATPKTSNSPFVYESRVLEGIWAAAPYLHNGSVPTLADLLEPCEKRPAFFDVGVDYDVTDKVGLASVQGGPLTSRTVTTSLPATQASGNYRCGHEGVEFGTYWTPLQKRAMVEYLKSL